MIEWSDITDMVRTEWKDITDMIVTLDKVSLTFICIIAVIVAMKLILNIVNVYLDRKILATRVKVLERMLENAQNVYQPTQDEIDAVRFAMKKAHPDNGGNAEDFVRFSAVYETLRGYESHG